MNESRNTKPVSDEELIGVLTAISVVSKRLAKKLIQLNQTTPSFRILIPRRSMPPDSSSAQKHRRPTSLTVR